MNPYSHERLWLALVPLLMVGIAAAIGAVVLVRVVVPAVSSIPVP